MNVEDSVRGTAPMSRLTLSSVITINPDVTFRELDGEIVILNLETGIYFGLDAVVRGAWRRPRAGARGRARAGRAALSGRPAGGGRGGAAAAGSGRPGGRRVALGGGRRVGSPSFRGPGAPTGRARGGTPVTW